MEVEENLHRGTIHFIGYNILAESRKKEKRGRFDGSNSGDFRDRKREYLPNGTTSERSKILERGGL